jgi:hypothetical protein
MYLHLLIMLWLSEFRLFIIIIIYIYMLWPFFVCALFSICVFESWMYLNKYIYIYKYIHVFSTLCEHFQHANKEPRHKITETINVDEFPADRINFKLLKEVLTKVNYF